MASLHSSVGGEEGYSIAVAFHEPPEAQALKGGQFRFREARQRCIISLGPLRAGGNYQERQHRFGRSKSHRHRSSLGKRWPLSPFALCDAKVRTLWVSLVGRPAPWQMGVRPEDVWLL